MKRNSTVMEKIGINGDILAYLWLQARAYLSKLNSLF
jgi:hypothetical protein